MNQSYSKWVLLILLTGVFVGAASAFFLWSLDQVTSYRTTSPWLLFTLPVIGGCIAMLYAKTNHRLSNGNAMIIQNFFKTEIKETKPMVPVLLAPLIFISTLLTHLGGGAAGREGTAVQMGASLASQLSRWFRLNRIEQRLLTCMGISAGFAGVFGTPLAASIFAFEFFGFRKTKLLFVIPCLLTAYLADFICISLGIQHAHYVIVSFSDYNLSTMAWLALSGFIFGFTALLFVQSGQLFSKLFSKIASPILRPVIGGTVIATIVYFTGQEKMTGLGLKTISDAFVQQQASFDFLIKLLLTSCTLSAGFKGGEVTPLFFIGAVLGSALIAFVPLPISLLAGLGLIAVFAGATHCILSAIFLGIELYGLEYGVYIALVCVLAYLISGTKNIYEGRPMGKIKKAMSPYFF